MPFFNRLRDIAAGAALVGLLAGCSDAASSAVAASISPALGQPQSARQSQSAMAARDTSVAFADPDAASTGSVIIGSLAGEVDVYTDSLKLAARITGIERPEGLALDASGNLYVANLGNGRSSPGIFVYKSDYKTLIATLSDTFPTLGVAVDNTTGLVAAINGDPALVGSVTFFTNGATTPCTTVTDANVREVWQGAFDRTGNLYVTAGSPDGIHSLVGVIQGGCSAQKITLLSTANTFSSFIFGIQITQFGKIAIEDQVARAIYTYNPPISGALGTPIATTPLAGAPAPEQFAFTEKGAFLFVANQTSPGKAFKYAYTAGGAPLQSFAAKTTEQFGLVVTPAAQQ